MSFLTIAGEQQLANKQANGERVNIDKFVLAYIPDQGSEPEDRIEALPDASFIVESQPYLKRAYVGDNQVVYSLVLDATIGDYQFNWIGLVDDEDVLIAVAYIITIQKMKTTGSVRGNTIARNFLLKYTGIQNLTATTVPAETWQLDFSARMTGIDERERLSNFDIFGHESFLNDAWKVSGEKGAYQVATGVGYVGGIRIENQDDTLIKTFDYPNQLWLNVSLQGDVSDRSAVVAFIMDSGDFKDYEDDNGITHYLTKLADIAADGSVTDTRKIYENVAQHEAKDDPHPQYKEYTDTKTAAALTAAKSDATKKSNTALSSAQAYADEQASAALASAKTYTDGLDVANVKLTGAQSVAGRKTFSTAPRSSVAPTNNADLARKDYVDDMGSSTLSSAQSDATSKADTVLASAKTYASNANNLTSGTVADARLPSDLVRDSDLGTVAAEDVTSTTEPTTKGEIPKIGDWNLFLTNPAVWSGVSDISDWDDLPFETLPDGAVLRVTGAKEWLNRPDDNYEHSNYRVSVEKWAKTWGRIVVTQINTNHEVFSRTIREGNWSSWARITTDVTTELSGSIHFFATETSPRGFIKANGAAVSRTTYATLFSKIGTTFGAGDGSSTFNVPDLRGEFIRGYDDARGVDAARVFGSWQEDAFKSHTHNFTRENTRGSGSSGASDGSSSFYTSTTAATGGSETRPRNIALAAYIKY